MAYKKSPGDTEIFALTGLIGVMWRGKTTNTPPEGGGPGRGGVRTRLKTPSFLSWRRTGRGVGSILGRGDFGSVWTEKSKIWVLGTDFWGQNWEKSKNPTIFQKIRPNFKAVGGGLRF